MLQLTKFSCKHVLKEMESHVELIKLRDNLLAYFNLFYMESLPGSLCMM